MHWRNILILFTFSLLVFIPGISSIPPLDRDESRFAQASKQMIETGDYVDIRFQETPRYKKPVGAYWVQAATVNILSPDNLNYIWAYRIPSLLASLAAVILTYAIACLFIKKQSFWWKPKRRIPVVVSIESKFRCHEYPVKCDEGSNGVIKFH